jgi:hypothetical protein
MYREKVVSNGSVCSLWSDVRIRGSGSLPKCHGSGTVLGSICFAKDQQYIQDEINFLSNIEHQYVKSFLSQRLIL